MRAVIIESLGKKITSMMLIFLLVGIAAICMTLFMSWRLMGSSAAINDAGSLRMQAYQIGYTFTRNVSGYDNDTETVNKLIAQFERTLSDLRTGDPLRPLFIPRDDGIPDDVEKLMDTWAAQVRPLFSFPSVQPVQLKDKERLVAAKLPGFVTDIDVLVRKMERSYERSTNILQLAQAGLLLFATISTLILLRFFQTQVIRPVSKLAEGVEHWRKDDFGYRLAISSNDEFGRLSDGFNRAAAHLQNLYETLEERVAEKTQSLLAKNRELKILYTVSDYLREATDMDGLCHGYTQRVMEMMDADAGSVRLLDSSAQQLCIVANKGLDETFLQREALLDCAECICGKVSLNNQGVRIVDIQHDDEVMLDACRFAGFRTVICASIPVNRVSIGAFNLFYREKRTPGDSDRQLLESLCQQFGTAINNLRLQSSERELAVSEERNLLARELHDSIAQALAFMNLQVQMLESALERHAVEELRSGIVLLRQGLQESYEDIRELMLHFRARVGQRSLDAAISSALDRLAEQANIEVHLDIRGKGIPFSAETETQLLYIVQEALSNVRKHARARKAGIILERQQNSLTITVSDDGIGFEVDDTGANTFHIGLQIMKERAQRIGGQLSIASCRGEGTTVSITLQTKEAL